MSIETFGDYQLIKRLATGGMAQIYLARKLGPEGFSKFNVVKRILPHLSENDEFVKMFLDEARIAARLNHPNIVQIYDFGAADESYFISMEFIHGEDVRRVWKAADAAGRSIPIPLICRIVSDAAAGLDYAHAYTEPSGLALNIVHRDVSPQNILVTFEGGVKVVDFGIAKAADQATVTRSGVLKGKYSYMSPEQASGQRVDRRTDIFALGVVMYELLTRERLFKRSNDIQTLSAVAECNVAAPSSVDPTIPRDLDAIVLKALAKDPAERYQEAGQLRLALEDWLTENRQAGSSVHLSAFMKELFAERLAEERVSGPAMMSELEEALPPPQRQRSTSGSAQTRAKQPESTTSARPERASPSQPSLRMRPRTRLSSDALEALEPLEPIDSLPPPVDLPTPLRAQEPPLERSVTHKTPMAHRTGPEHSFAVTESGASATAKDPSRSPRAALGLAVVVAAVVVLGGGAWLLTRPGEAQGPGPGIPPASVRLETHPAGARVVVDGVPVEGETPLELPPLPAGRHGVELRREGYQPWMGAVDVPPTGEVRVPAVHLVAENEGRGEPQVKDAGSAVAVVEGSPVTLELHTQPEGAQLEINGRAVGGSPLTYRGESSAVVRVRATLAGFLDAEREVRLGTAPLQQESLTLRKKAVVGPQGTGAGAGGGAGGGVIVGRGGEQGGGEVRGTGVLKIVVPGTWATVECNGQKLGETPFPPREMVAGSYRCTFSNPTEGEVTRAVELKAGKTETVIVQFP